ncbi:MAG: hypothetical protein KDN22_25865 [Verrucomicrobiae bacterium]|nr:hypothetical protein [Verrucomicrobiae bacterium]
MNVSRIAFPSPASLSTGFVLLLSVIAASAQTNYRVVTEQATHPAGPWLPIVPTESAKDSQGYPLITEVTSGEQYFRSRLVPTMETDANDAARVVIEEAIKAHPPGEESIDYAFEFFSLMQANDAANGSLNGQWAGAKIAPSGHYVYDPLIGDGQSPAYFELKIIPADIARNLSGDDGWAKIAPPADERAADDLGYILVSLTLATEPIVEYSPVGVAPVDELAAKISEAQFRPMRFGAGFLAAEALNGALLGSIGVAPRMQEGAEAETRSTPSSRSSEVSFNPQPEPPGQPRTFFNYADFRSEWKQSPPVSDARARQSASAGLSWDAIGAKISPDTLLKVALQPGQFQDIFVGQDVELHSLLQPTRGGAPPIDVTALRGGGLRIAAAEGVNHAALTAQIKLPGGRGTDYGQVKITIGNPDDEVVDLFPDLEVLGCGEVPVTVQGTGPIAVPSVVSAEICFFEHGQCVTVQGKTTCEFEVKGSHFPVYAPAIPTQLLCANYGRGVTAWSSLLAWWDCNGLATNAFGHNDLVDAPVWGNNDAVDALQATLFEVTGSNCPAISKDGLVTFGAGATRTTSMHRALDLFPPRLQTTQVGYTYDDLTSTTPGEAAQLAIAALRDGRPAIIAQDDSRYWIASQYISHGDANGPIPTQTHFRASMATVGANGNHIVYTKYISAAEIIFACDATFWNR